MILMGADLRVAAGVSAERSGAGGISADDVVGAGLETVFEKNFFPKSGATRATWSCAIRSSWICRWRRRFADAN